MAETNGMLALPVQKSADDCYVVRTSGGAKVVVLHPVFMKRNELKIGDRLRPHIDENGNYVLVPVRGSQRARG